MLDEIAKSRDVPLILLDPSVHLPSGVPPELPEPDPIEYGDVRGVELRADAEEVVEPEEAAWSQHAVDVEQRKLQHDIGDPVAEHVHRVHDVERVLEEGQPVGDADVHRHEASRRDEAVEGPVEVHRGGDDRYVALDHPGRKRAGATAYVEPDADCPTGLGLEDVVDAVVELAVVVHPPYLFSAVQIEAVLAVVGARRLVSLDQTRVVLAGVRLPDDAGVGRYRPEAGGERGGAGEPGWGLGMAATAREGLTPFEHQPLREDIVGGALSPDGVHHVLDQLVLEPAAGGSESRVELIGSEIGGEPEGELVGPDSELELPGELVLPTVPIPGWHLFPLGSSEVGEEGFEEGVGGGEPAVKLGDLGLGDREFGLGGVELSEERVGVPEVDPGGVGRPLEGEGGAGEEVDGEYVGR